MSRGGILSCGRWISLNTWLIARLFIFLKVSITLQALSRFLWWIRCCRVRQSLYAMIEPMDIIEIRMAHAPSSYEDRIPVVMRGFVGMIRRSRSMSGGKPQRTVMVAGNDYGKILQILRIYYLNNSAVGDNIVAEMKFS
jgi:hypothetical protein